ncbi:hypothetical protein L2E82_08069 [Cichorium intybus]|uniref:Uncharacterized protein n=1 Tax=Cichorium intybus TaxID=13427 RepID=A0ACB9G646_CICIN|nr:hypothetical protein L2E82_08069 [Cichorium intybus]
MQPSCSSDTSRPEVEASFSKSDQTTMQTLEERLQSSRPMVDGMLNQFGMENHVEETGDELSNGDHSLVELEVEKESSDNNNQDSGSKIKKNRGSHSQNTLATVLLDGQPCAREDTTVLEANNSWDDYTTLHEPNNSWDNHTTLREVNNSWDDLTALQEANNSWDDITTPQETNNSWDDWKHPSFASDMSQPEAELSVSTSGKREKIDDEHINDYHSPSNLVLEKESNNKNTQDAEIKEGRQRTRSKKNKGNLNICTTAIVDGQHCAGEDTTLQEANSTCNDLLQPSFAFDTSQPEVEFVVSRSDDATMDTFVGRGQSSRSIVDGFLNQSVTGQEWKVKQNMGLHCSNMTECLLEENQVEDTGDEHSNGDYSLVELEAAKQSNDNNTKDSGSKTGMRISRRKKSKMIRDSTTQNTLATVLLDGQTCAREDTSLQEANNSWDDLTTLHEPKNPWDDHTTLREVNNSWDDLTTQHEANNSWDDLKQPSFASDMSHRKVELSVSTSVKETNFQTTAERLQSSKRMVGGFSSHSVMGWEWKVVEKVGSESSTTTEALAEEKYVEETEANTTCNDPMQPSFVSDMSQPEVHLLASKSSETTVQTFVEILQSSRPVVDGFLNYVGSESSSITDQGLQEEKHVEEMVDDHNIGDHSPQELVSEKQSSNDNTEDVENKKGKGKYVAGEDTTMCASNRACSDLDSPSSSFDMRIKTLDVLKCGSIMGLAAAYLGIRCWRKT